MSTTGSGRAQRLLDDQIEPFLQHLRDAGYAERTLRKKRTVARAFARWAKGKGIATIDLNDGHVDAFVLRLPRGGKSRRKFELAAVRLFLGYLRATAGSAVPVRGSPQLIHCQPSSTVRESPAQGSRARGEFASRLLAADPDLSRVQIRGHWFPAITEGAHDSGLRHRTDAQSVCGVCPPSGDSTALVLSLSLSFRPYANRPLSFRAQSLQIPPFHSARISRTGRSDACAGGNGSSDAQRTSGLRDPAPPCQAWSARRRDRFAGTGRYLLADRRDRRPWEGPHDRAFAPAAGYRRSLGRLPSQGSWRQQITTNLLANVGAAYRSDGSSGGGPHCAPSARASGDSALRARRRPSVPPRLSNADDSPWRLSAGDCGSSSPSFPNDHFRLHPGGIRGIA